MDSLVSSLFAAHNFPFSVALALMAMLLIVQMAGLGLDSVDVDVDADTHLGAVDGLMSVAGLNRLPFITWLTIFLGLFGLIGLTGQQLIASLIGVPIDAWLGGLIAGVAAVPVTGLIARPVAAILPRDESTAVDRAELVGFAATIIVGTAAQGSPARAQVRDHHGQVHQVMVEPDNAGQRFDEGAAVRLVRQEGEVFRVIADGQVQPGWLTAE